VPLAGPANRAGRLVADDILAPERARAIPAPIGTAIVRVGDVVAAMTGANRASLDAAGATYHTLHLHPGNHASYFPGTEALHMLLHVSARDGRLLGAQVVGVDGVDKRIDVLATAIRAGMSVSDLVDLDLAYAPPFGSAKDPVSMAGYLGQNVLEGMLSLWYADQVEDVMDTALVLDVRTEAEFARGHLTGALNVPHTQLRARLDEVRDAAAGRPVRVMDADGLRGHLAHRVLAQHGIDSASLSGGMTTLMAAAAARAGCAAGRRRSRWGPIARPMQQPGRPVRPPMRGRFQRQRPASVRIRKERRPRWRGRASGREPAVSATGPVVAVTAVRPVAAAAGTPRVAARCRGRSFRSAV